MLRDRLETCTVDDVPLGTAGDLVLSRERYIAGFTTCAARIDAIREHDREARERFDGQEERRD